MIFGLVKPPVDYSCVCGAVSGLSVVALLRLVDNSWTWVLRGVRRLEDAGARLRNDVTGVVSNVQHSRLHDGWTATWLGEALQ